MKIMLLLHGITGSGKSTLANKIKQKYKDIVVLSTDEYWGKDYNFDVKKLSVAHLWNHKRCKDYCELGHDVLIDNTNLTFKEIEVYLDIAKEFGYWVDLISTNTEWNRNVEECFSRNKHRVPKQVIERQLNRLDITLKEQIIRWIL